MEVRQQILELNDERSELRPGKEVTWAGGSVILELSQECGPRQRSKSDFKIICNKDIFSKTIRSMSSHTWRTNSSSLSI